MVCELGDHDVARPGARGGYARLISLTSACSAILAGCAGSMPDEHEGSANARRMGDSMSDEQPNSRDTAISIARPKGMLTFGFARCLDHTAAIPIKRIFVTDASQHIRCIALARSEQDPKLVSSWTYGSDADFHVPRCDALEANREYIIYIQRVGRFGAESHQTFELSANGSIHVRGKLCTALSSLPPAPSAAQYSCARELPRGSPTPSLRNAP